MAAYVKREKSAKKKKGVGPGLNVSSRTTRGLVRMAQQRRMTVQIVLQKSVIDVSQRTVQRILFEVDHLHFGPFAKRSKFVDIPRYDNTLFNN